MRVVEINSCNHGSTGNIMLNIAQHAQQKGIEVVTCYPKSRSNMQKKINNRLLIGSRLSRNFHIMLGKLTGFQDCFSIIATLKLLQKLNNNKPDIVHLHNLHGDYINLALLFYYIKKNQIPVVWTLHDCWSMTGQCPHFTMVNCNRWKTGCHNCPQYREYPASYVDRTKKMWKLKRKWFTGVTNMTIVTPSKWLCDLVKESYLKEYQVRVINNGINLDVFKPTLSNFRERYGIRKGKYIVLFVAFGWEKRKGLDVIQLLSELLDDRFQLVVVGTDESIDQILSSKIISIHRTQNQSELAEIYTIADIFVNPTREENYPTVNMEALACGTPVITFRTGGSPEIINRKTGAVVESDDIEAMKNTIMRICESQPYSSEACLQRAKEFDKDKRFEEYVALYREIELVGKSS